jgi:phage-related protein
MFTNTFAGIGKMFATITRRTQWILLGQTIRAVIADAKESVQDLRTYNQDFDKSMQSIRDSFKNVGNAIATSFAPILQALAPIIANVARWLTELFNKITLFTTALFTGAKTAVIADTNFSGYAKSTKKATANTKKGTKAIKEQTNALAKFDKLDIFKQD